MGRAVRQHCSSDVICCCVWSGHPTCISRPHCVLPPFSSQTMWTTYCSSSVKCRSSQSSWVDEKARLIINGSWILKNSFLKIERKILSLARFVHIPSQHWQLHVRCVVYWCQLPITQCPNSYLTPLTWFLHCLPHLTLLSPRLRLQTHGQWADTIPLSDVHPLTPRWRSSPMLLCHTWSFYMPITRQAFSYQFSCFIIDNRFSRSSVNW